MKGLHAIAEMVPEAALVNEMVFIGPDRRVVTWMVLVDVEASKVLSFDKDREVMDFWASNNCETYGFELHGSCLLCRKSP